MASRARAPASIGFYLRVLINASPPRSLCVSVCVCVSVCAARWLRSCLAADRPLDTLRVYLSALCARGLAGVCLGLEMIFGDKGARADRVRGRDVSMVTTVMDERGDDWHARRLYVVASMNLSGWPLTGSVLYFIRLY